MVVAQLQQLDQDRPPHQAERPAGEFERVNIFAHGLENIFKMPFA
jgi:hypothetical protein